MPKINIKEIKKLREKTGAGVLEAKKALEDTDNDYEKAVKLLLGKVSAKADKKADREASEGLVHSYIHANGKVGSLVLIACETDFVAKTDDFKKLCHEVALQVATDDYENIEELVKAEYIKDTDKTIQDLVKETIAKLGENIQIKEFTRLSVK